MLDARAFNEWLQNRQLKRQGEEYADAMGRSTAESPSSGGPARSGGKCSEPRSSWPRASRQNRASASECVLASRRRWNTSKKASLLSASLCPTATTDPATSTWTNIRNPRSRWPKIQGRTLSWERPSRTTSNPPTMAIKADLSLNCSAPVFCSLGPTQTRRTKLTGEMA